MAFRATLHRAPEFAELALSDRPTLLVAPFIASGSITLLFGPPSAGKTHLMTSMACALAQGEPLWGIYPTQKSRVLIVQADMNTALYQERVKQNAAKLTSNTAILTTDGFPFDVCAIKQSDPIVGAIREFAPHFTIVDTLRKTHGADENDSMAADRVYAAWRTLIPGSAFMLGHHTRKISLQATTQDTITREAFRGSGAWAAGADTLLMLRRARKQNNPDWMTRLIFVRTRSCEEPSPLLLRLNPELMLEPLSETLTERKLLMWISANPRSRRVDAVQWLLEQQNEEGQPLCSRATAYRIWDRIVRGELNG